MSDAFYIISRTKALVSYPCIHLYDGKTLVLKLRLTYDSYRNIAMMALQDRNNNTLKFCVGSVRDIYIMQ